MICSCMSGHRSSDTGIMHRNRKKYGKKQRYRRLRQRIIQIAGLCLILAAGPAMYTHGQAFSNQSRLAGAAILRGMQGESGFLCSLADFWEGVLQWFSPGSSGSWEATPAGLTDIPEYTGEPYAIIDGNNPGFTPEELAREPYEAYGKLDLLGRCTAAEAMISEALMPTQPREGIGMIRPTGWHTVKYDVIEDRYLYNRCHLVGYQLTGENANERNLITGTRYMNVSGMLPWENLVADYIRRTGDRVMYRATPIFEGFNMLASGVHIQAQSVFTDNISFNIFVYNVQPGIRIDYLTGRSRAE